jgi:hypothetical protein
VNLSPATVPATTTAPCHYIALIPHPSRPQVVLRFRDDLWYLPQWTEQTPFAWQSVQHVNMSIHEHVGVTATTLRCFQHEDDVLLSPRMRVYEMENRSAAWTPPGRDRWVGRDMLDRLPLGEPAQHAILARWFTEIEPEQVALRPPWARRGWLDATTNWIRDQFRQRGITFQQVEQVTTADQGCLVRVQTDAGSYYFQAVAALPAHAIPLLTTLGQWLPGRIPQIVTHDTAHHWLLLDDFAGQLLDEIRDITIWHLAARRFAEMQIGLALRMGELQALGCPEYATLDGADQPERRAAWVALEQLGLPMSLENGNLTGTTIVLRGADVMFCDWSQSAIAHPFFSLLPLLASARAAFPAVPDAATQVRDAYLSAWALYRPMEDLQAAFSLAQSLAPLHFALAAQRTF